MPIRRVLVATETESYKVLPVRGFLWFAHWPSRIESTSIRSPGGCRSGGCRTQQDLKVIKWYLPEGSLVSTSARSARKHFDQEPGRMPIRGLPDSSGANRN